MLWLAFIVIVLVLFAANWERIKAVIANTNLLSAGKPAVEEPKPGAKPASPAIDRPATDKPVTVDKPATADEPPTDKPPASATDKPPPTDKPAATAADKPAAASKPPADKAPEYRDAKLFFVVVGDDGGISVKETKRTLKVTGEPLKDSVTALLAGPSSADISRGLVSLIPSGTRLLSASIRGTTAELDFTQDFLFTKYGPEGLVAQIKQVVWTATAFGTVVDVLFKIEGKPVAYMAEGLRTDRPFRRSSLP